MRFFLWPREIVLGAPLRSTVFLLAFSLLPACGSDKTSSPAPGTDGGLGSDGDGDGATQGLSTAALLDAFGRCALSSAQAFQTAAVGLDDAARAYAATPNETTKNAARAAYALAWDSWQVAELHQFGPARRTMPGGQGLRDQIYAWNLVRPCSVDELLASGGYASADFARSLISQRGLAALEYLLYAEGVASKCTKPPTGWSELTADDLAARRRAYAQAATADLVKQATTLVSAWDPKQGNFLHTFTTAGAGNDVFKNSHVAINTVSDALFYFDTELKDMKVAAHTTLSECLEPSCPESPHAGLSKQAVAGNVVGFRQLFEGCAADFSGLGFYDLLEDRNAAGLAENLRMKLAAIAPALDAIEETDLRTARANDEPSVRALYDAIKGVTDLLKTEMMSALDLERPESAGTDND